MTNREIALRLREHAQELERLDGNLFRQRAFRQAAALVSAWPEPLPKLIAEHGPQALEAIPGIGASLAYTIEGLARDGEFRTLSGDDGQRALDRLLTSIPGIGQRLARRLRDELKVTTLEQLEAAAHDGRLRQLGVAEKRLHEIQQAVAARLGPRTVAEPIAGEPSIDELLQIDEEFRDRVHRRSRTISRLPYPELEMERNGWRLRAFWANTSLTHRMHAAHDWVMIEFENERHSGQRTIVTEKRGCLRGQRVVRGRENECMATNVLHKYSALAKARG
jgi:DNA polymerase/3'-5' exonuclease PolX